jgi:hypothetical protein
MAIDEAPYCWQEATGLLQATEKLLATAEVKTWQEPVASLRKAQMRQYGKSSVGDKPRYRRRAHNTMEMRQTASQASEHETIVSDHAANTIYAQMWSMAVWQTRVEVVPDEKIEEGGAVQVLEVAIDRATKFERVVSRLACGGKEKGAGKQA